MGYPCRRVMCPPPCRSSFSTGPWAVQSPMGRPGVVILVVTAEMAVLHSPGRPLSAYGGPATASMPRIPQQPLRRGRGHSCLRQSHPPCQHPPCCGQECPRSYSGARPGTSGRSTRSTRRRTATRGAPIRRAIFSRRARVPRRSTRATTPAARSISSEPPSAEAVPSRASGRPRKGPGTGQGLQAEVLHP